MVPIFVEHWGDNLQFYPNFALFSTLGGMNLDHDFAQLWKFSEDQRKKCKWNTFSPRIQVKTKQKKSSWSKIQHFFFPNSGEDQKQKRSSSKIEHFFPSNFNTHLKYLGGCRCGPFSNYWGGYSQIIGGIYPPIPPGFRHPWC